MTKSGDLACLAVHLIQATHLASALQEKPDQNFIQSSLEERHFKRVVQPCKPNMNISHSPGGD